MSSRTRGKRPAERLMERVRAGVAQEIVAGQDVVHLEAFAAHEPLADIALEERVVVYELLPLPVTEHTFARRSAARLTRRREGHLEVPESPEPLELTTAFSAAGLAYNVLFSFKQGNP